MLFNSREFVVFFVLIFGLYHALRRRLHWQNTLLLAASYLFYGWWDVRFLYLIVVSTAVDYSAGMMIQDGSLSRPQRIRVSLYLIASALLFVVPDYSAIQITKDGLSFSANVNWWQLISNGFGWRVLIGTVVAIALAYAAYPWATRLPEDRRRRVFVFVSVAMNLGILGVFKYFNFFAENLAELSQTLFHVEPSRWTMDIVLPVGISFYTFQTMSYTLDIYRKEVEASHRLTEFATYVAFFPQLVAGPIERAKRLLPQFRKSRPSLTLAGFRAGAWLITWGLFKKIVVADNMATVVQSCFEPYDALPITAGVPHDGLTLLVGVYAFAFQIYGDFSGYSDIARGTAKLMGFDIILNFRLPYFATSPSSFWRRWHISLSTWLRDYLYISLGGNRSGTVRMYVNLTLTMLLGGLWHGASWTFIVWGLYHGFLLVAFRIAGLRTEQKEHSWWVNGLLGLFMFQLTCMGWLIFRASNLETIGIFLESIFLHPSASDQTWTLLWHVVRFQWFLLVFQIAQGINRDLDPMQRWHWFVRLNVWIYVLMALYALSATGKREFIYFDF